MSDQWLTLWRYADTFLAAAWLTLQVTLLAVALGLLSALAKVSPLAPLPLPGCVWCQLLL